MKDTMNDVRLACLDELNEARAIERMLARDASLWTHNEPAAASVRNRLGWLFCLPSMQDHIDRLATLFRNLERKGRDRALVIGMGGSSLWPEVVGRHLAGQRGLRLRVLDSTHPAAIADALAWARQGDPQFVIATKSGGTVETLSLYRILRDRFDDGERFVAVTDPGSGLCDIARNEDFFALFENPADIGGRFSAASLFGLVPAVLTGVVLKDALARAESMLQACSEPNATENPGAQLAAFMAAAHRTGRSHLRIATNKDSRGFASWVEQLVAESTGKLGNGLLPVPGRFAVGDGAALQHSVLASVSTFEDPDEAFVSMCDELGVPVDSVVMPSLSDLWGEVIRWEVATALCGRLLGINPFDEPDVSAAKAATSALLAGEKEPVAADDTRSANKLTALPDLLADELQGLGADDYIAVLLYVAPVGADRQRAAAIREVMQERTAGAVTVQFGPRYLHSTGQLHKGGPAKGRFVVVHDLGRSGDIAGDLPIPGAAFSAGELIRAQMLGDIAVLKERGKHVIEVAL